MGVLKGLPPLKTIGSMKLSSPPKKERGEQTSTPIFIGDPPHLEDSFKENTSCKCYLPARTLRKIDVYMRLMGMRGRAECLEFLVDEQTKSLPPFFLSLFRELTELGQEIRLCREQHPEKTEQVLATAETVLDGLYDFLKRQGHIGGRRRG